MAKTLLNGVNEVLKKVDVLEGDTGLLTSLVDSARQTFIDAAIQALNETVDHLYSILEQTKPKQLGEANLTLVTSDRDYALDSTLVTLLPKFGLINSTTNHVIQILKDDGYRQIILGDLAGTNSGLPSTAAIRPTDGELYMDRIPTAAQNGLVYKYRFNKELELVLLTDTFPFGNTVFRAVVPAAAELWRRNRQQEFSQAVFDGATGQAARLISLTPMRSSWQPSHHENTTDPFST